MHSARRCYSHVPDVRRSRWAGTRQPAKLYARWRLRVCGYTPSVPSIRIDGSYEIYFTSHDRGEPAHVHVDRERMTAKLWLAPVRVAFNLGLSRHELRRIERIVSEHEQKCLKAWNDYFGTWSG